MNDEWVGFSTYERRKTEEIGLGDLKIGGKNPIRKLVALSNFVPDQVSACIQTGADLIRIPLNDPDRISTVSSLRNLLLHSDSPVALIAEIPFDLELAEAVLPLVDAISIDPPEERVSAEKLLSLCQQQNKALWIKVTANQLMNSEIQDVSFLSWSPLFEAASILGFDRLVLDFRVKKIQKTVPFFKKLATRLCREYQLTCPIHLEAAEAKSGKEGRVFSTVAIGAFLMDGWGDTFRFTLEEDPQFEIPIATDFLHSIQKYLPRHVDTAPAVPPAYDFLSPFFREARSIESIGGDSPSVVIADYSQGLPEKQDLESIGFRYNEERDSWEEKKSKADFIYTAHQIPAFKLPSHLKLICDIQVYDGLENKDQCFPLYTVQSWLEKMKPSGAPLNFLLIDCKGILEEDWQQILKQAEAPIVFCLFATGSLSMHHVRRRINDLLQNKINNPIVLCIESMEPSVDTQIIQFAAEAAPLLVNGLGNGLWLKNYPDLFRNPKETGRSHIPAPNNHQFLTDIANLILTESLI